MTETNDQNAPAPQDPPGADPAGSSTPEPSDEASIVWLVSFADDDDRELKAPQIAESLRLGEITAQTIVWREGAVDWKPLGEVPELAKLMPASGETATAPLVAPNPVLMRRATTNKEQPAAQDVPKPAATSVVNKPMIAGRSVPAVKGTTKLGLPKIEPKPDATPLPKAALPKKPEATPLPKAKESAPVTPTNSRARTSSPDIWAAPTGEEEDPISIEPEFLRPPSPAPARAMHRAKALSAGTLGMPKKKPPTPPRPPEKRGAAEREQPAETGTPSLGTLAAPTAATEPNVAEREIPNIAAPSVAESELGAPTIDVSNLSAAPAESPADRDSKEESTSTPTESSASIAVPPAASDERTEITRPAAHRSSPPKTAKWNSWPVIAVGGVVLLLGWLFMQGKKPAPEAPPAEVEAPAVTATTGDPVPTEERARAAEPPAPTPAMTVEKAPDESTLEQARAKAPESTGKAPAAGAGTPTTSVVKTEQTGTKEAKQAEPKPAQTKAAEPKPAAAPSPEPAAKEVAVGGDFDKAAAAAALGGAATEASGCRKEGDPSGVAVVHVTFSNAGRATRAVIEGPPFAGTATGGCIASTLRKATVPPYGGDRVTVTKKVVIN